MKNIFEILSGIGVEVPEDKKSDLETALKESYMTVSEVKKITTARDNYKNQLDTAQTALKEFEGVDVKELRGKIETLTNDLATKEKEYQDKIADMEFNAVLDSAITKSGARNAKAVKALLDLDSLKTSKNQADDITKALESVKSENDYMFSSNEPFQNPVKDTGNSQVKGKRMSLIDAMKYKNEHPDADINTLINIGDE